TDLIGKHLVNQNGEDRGVVVDINELPQAKYLVVKYNEKNRLIPFINEFIGEVRDVIEVKEIEGLF
nr:PRC-barrel domain-containing protein [Acholeplasmatales bacterium]